MVLPQFQEQRLRQRSHLPGAGNSWSKVPEVRGGIPPRRGRSLVEQRKRGSQRQKSLEEERKEVRESLLRLPLACGAVSAEVLQEQA